MLYIEKENNLFEQILWKTNHNEKDKSVLDKKGFYCESLAIINELNHQENATKHFPVEANNILTDNISINYKDEEERFSQPINQNLKRKIEDQLYWDRYKQSGWLNQNIAKRHKIFNSKRVCIFIQYYKGLKI